MLTFGAATLALCLSASSTSAQSLDGPDRVASEADEQAILPPTPAEAALWARLEGGWVVDLEATIELARQADGPRRAYRGVQSLRIRGGIWGLRVTEGRSCPATNLTLDESEATPTCANVQLRAHDEDRFFLSFAPRTDSEEWTEEFAYFRPDGRWCRRINEHDTCFRRPTAQEDVWLLAVDDALQVPGCSMREQEQMAELRDAALSVAGSVEEEARRITLNGVVPTTPSNGAVYVIGRGIGRNLGRIAEDVDFLIPPVLGCFLDAEPRNARGEQANKERIRGQIIGEWRETETDEVALRITEDAFCWRSDTSPERETPNWRCREWTLQTSHSSLSTLVLRYALSALWYIESRSAGELCVVLPGRPTCYVRSGD